MAKCTFDMGSFGDNLERLASRESIRRIVEAGSAEAVKIDIERTIAAGHVITGQMRDAISAGPVHEDLGKAWQYVYPQGTGDHGQDLQKVAFVINYGYGGRKTAKTGDKFITGKSKQLDDAVGAAMAAEAERVLNDIMR